MVNHLLIQSLFLMFACIHFEWLLSNKMSRAMLLFVSVPPGGDPTRDGRDEIQVGVHARRLRQTMDGIRVGEV